jgi:outer membrane protein assembly factor BamE (lipoprotein component of BamABCDE complex)
MTMPTLSLRRSLALLLLTGAAACTPIVDNRGNAPPPEALATVKPGATRTQVAQLLGSPSNIATFNDKTWYYISRKTETEAFFAPEAVDQQIVIVKFDDSGVVTNIEQRKGMKGTTDITPVSRVTPTAGHSLGLLEQLFGNVGRFSGLPGAPGRGGRSGGP